MAMVLEPEYYSVALGGSCELRAPLTDLGGPWWFSLNSHGRAGGVWDSAPRREEGEDMTYSPNVPGRPSGCTFW